MKQIEVKIGGGNVSVTPTGYKGESCKDATAALEKALGKVTEDTPTDEMYQTEVDDTLYEGEGG